MVPCGAATLLHGDHGGSTNLFKSNLWEGVTSGEATGSLRTHNQKKTFQKARRWKINNNQFIALLCFISVYIYLNIDICGTHTYLSIYLSIYLSKNLNLSIYLFIYLFLSCPILSYPIYLHEPTFNPLVSLSLEP